jgi:hypothetical protein
MTTTNGSGLVKSKELLIQTNIAMEDLLDVAATMLNVWKGGDERQKKRIGVGLKQLVQCLQKINDNLQESFRLFISLRGSIVCYDTRS